MAILAISVAPAGVGASVSKYVAKAIQLAQEDKRVTVEPGPMFTSIEGDIEACFDIARRMHECLFEDDDVKRVSTVIKIDDRRDKEITMSGKMQAVRRQLGRE